MLYKKISQQKQNVPLENVIPITAAFVELK